MLIVNASPLIVLARSSRLDLLRETRPGREVVIPGAVLDEVIREAGLYISDGLFRLSLEQAGK